MNQRRAARIAELAAGLAGLIATTVIVGYFLDIPRLIVLKPGFKGMSPLTATGLIIIATMVIAAVRRFSRVARSAAIAALLLAGAALASHAIIGADAISPVIIRAISGLPVDSAGRTSIAAALAILLVASSALMRAERPQLADAAAGAALVIAGTALLGYAYGVRDLYALPMFNNMALHTALVLFTLSGAALFLDPTRGWASLIAADSASGRTTRRHLLFIILPPVAGWLLLGWTGARLIGPGASMALLVVITVVPLALLVLRDGRALEAIEEERTAKAAILASAAADLERKLDDQAAALEHESGERAKAEAVLYRAQRMEAVGQLTGGIAHDFNNLLMAIQGSLDLLRRRMPSDDAKAQRYLDNALSSTERGAKITAQLLAFSRSQRLYIRPVELDPVLASARALIGHSLGPEIEIALDTDSAGLWITTDPDQLELALLNLAVNARDAMPEGGVLRISSLPAEAGDDSALPPDIVIRVADSGTGMSEEVAAKAIEPFFTTKEQGKGTGLGLAQVYGFARQCGGDLAITTAPGEGTTIDIRLKGALPVAAPAIAPVQIAVARPASEGLSPLLLVIDDDDRVRSVIVEALLGAGFRVEQANDGPSGLAILEHCTPAAAVIDFLMPGMNGAEVARRAQQRQPGLPIVFVSGYSDTLALDQIAGAVVLRKPFQMEALSRSLQSVMQ